MAIDPTIAKELQEAYSIFQGRSAENIPEYAYGYTRDQRMSDPLTWLPSGYRSMSHWDNMVDIGNNINPSAASRYNQLSPLERAKSVNPDGQEIPEGEGNPFGRLWKMGNTNVDPGLGKNPEEDSFLDKYGALIAIGAPLGLAAFGGAFGGGFGAGGFGSTGLTEGGALASEMGFVPGSFELGASGYGAGTSASAGLDLAGAEWLSNTIASPLSEVAANAVRPDSYWNMRAAANPGTLNDASILDDALQMAVKEGASGSTNTLGDFLGKLFDPIQKGMEAVNKGLGLEKVPFAMRQLIGSGANYLLQSSMADKYQSAAEKAARMSNPLEQAQRGQYQQQLSQLLTNPQQFFATNPAVQGQLDLARQQFQANTAKMGTGGTQFNDYLKNVQNIASGTFNDQANLLAGLGGFNQGPGYSGAVFGGLQDKSLQHQATQYGFLPDTIRKIFGDLGNMNNTTKQSPSGTNIVSSY